MRSFPSSEDYTRAVQRPDLVFRTPALRSAEFASYPPFYIPTPASGSTAIVFRATVGGRDQALRFFVREDASTKSRYTALNRHFDRWRLGDCVASVAWIEDGIEVNKQTWPVVQMDWVEGRSLDAYVGMLAEQGNQQALHTLAGHWRDRVGRLQSAEFAHGDLQHGNVLVNQSSEMQLVDFDGSWVSSFPEGTPPPSEHGHPNYQRGDRTWGRWMDTFPGLVIYTGLLALAERPAMWKDLQSGENIVFCRDDFVAPGTTRTWQMLEGLHNPEVKHVMERLRQCCAPGWGADGPLEALLAREHVTATPPPRTQPFVPDPNAPWWENTAAASGVGVPGGPAGGAMPKPPPREVPEAATRTSFDGATTGGGWPHQPGPPPHGAWPQGQQTGQPGPRPAGTGGGIENGTLLKGLGIAAAVALLVAVLFGALVNGSAAVGAGLVTLLLVFVVSLPLLNRSKP